MSGYIIEPKREITITKKVDLCVLGGSCTGVFAAVRAARLGLKVCIVEKANCFGGAATTGLVNVWHSLWDYDGNEQIIGGLTYEIIERLKEINAVSVHKGNNLAAFRLNTEELKLELDKLVAEEGIDVLFHTMYCDVYKENKKIKAIIIENKNGRQAIEANFFIDASGDGDIARDIGLKRFVSKHPQPPTPCFKIYGDIRDMNISELVDKHGEEFGLKEDWGWSDSIPNMPLVSFRADTHIFDVDCSNALDLSSAEIEGRKQIRAIFDILRKYHPNGKDISPVSICSHIGIRETNHYESNFKLKGEDMMTGTHYEDTVAYGTYPIDVHHSDNAGITFKHLNGKEVIHNDRISPPEIRYWRTGDDYAKYYEIPFKVLVQDEFENFIAVGRMINADESGFGAVRVMVNLNQLGEASGVAAYLSVKENTSVNKLSSINIRKLLAEGGSIML